MRRRVALSLLVLVTLLAAACAPRPPGGHGPKPLKPREPIPVRIAAPEIDNLQLLTFWVAVGAGLFEEEGLDVDLVTPAMPGQTGQLLLQGQADVAVLMPPLYLSMIAQEHPVKLFANLLTNDPINLVVAKDVADALDLDATAPLAERLEAIEGLRVGVASEPIRRLRVLFESVGMDADEDVDIVVTPGGAQVQALANGTVDALYTHTPYLDEALVDLEAFLLVNQSAGEVPELAGLQVHSLVTTQAYAMDDPKALLRVTRAVHRAQQLIHSDPAAAVQAVLASGIPGLVTPRVEAIVDVYGPAVPETPHVLPDGVVRGADLFPSPGGTPDFTQIDVNDYIDNRFADKAVRSGR